MSPMYSSKRDASPKFGSCQNDQRVAAEAALGVAQVVDHLVYGGSVWYGIAASTQKWQVYGQPTEPIIGTVRTQRRVRFLARLVSTKRTRCSTDGSVSGCPGALRMTARCWCSWLSISDRIVCLSVIWQT